LTDDQLTLKHSRRRHTTVNGSKLQDRVNSPAPRKDSAYEIPLSSCVRVDTQLKRYPVGARPRRKEARILLMPGLIATPEDEKTAGKAYLFFPDGLADL